MRPRALAILAAVVAALAAFVFFYERKLPSSDERRELENKAFRLDASEVTALRVEWQGQTVVLERQAPKPTKGEVEGGDSAEAVGAPDWRLVEPFPARADRTQIDRLTADLAHLEIVRRLAGATTQELGLEPPRGRVTWSTADSQGTLTIGGEVPASANVVVTATGRAEPLVVAKSFLADFDRAPGDWRAKELLPGGREDVERLRLLPAGGEEVVLVRHGENFDVERPYRDAADRDLVDPLLGDLTGLRAERFLDAPLTPAETAALTGGPGRIELALKGRTEPYDIELGGDTGQEGVRSLRADGQAVEARTRLAEALRHAAADWRSRSWSGFDSWRAERLRVTDAQGTVELVRDQGDWKRDGEKISYTEVGDLLYALSSARADRVVAGSEAASYPVASPSLTVVSADANGAEETLTLYEPRAGESSAPARVSGRDVVLLLPAPAVQEVRSRLAAVRAAPPLDELAAKPVAAAEPAPPKADAKEVPQ